MTSYPSTFELPTTDKLTDLLTSAYFRHLLREEILPQANNSEEPLTLFLLDSDNFKSVNDMFGHTCGDEVLAAISAVLCDVLPDSAVVARYGGDEFSGALPGTRLDDAFTLLEEARRRIAALTFRCCPDTKMTCSIGLASYPANGANDVELMRQADQALYNAKITGRNKVSLPLADSRMVTKTSHYTATQLDRLAQLAKGLKRNEATLLREALDDLFNKYKESVNTTTRDT